MSGGSAVSKQKSILRTWAKAQDVVFVAAQLGKSGTGWEEQLAQAFDQLSSNLIQAGCGLADVVKLGIFYHDSLVETERALLTKARAHFNGEHPPVVTAIPLHHLPNATLVQIEAIAVDPRSNRWKARKSFPGASLGVAPGFSACVRCDDLVFVGAQMSVDDQGQTQHEGNIAAQATSTLGNITAALALAGTDRSSVVKLNTYYVGRGTTEDWQIAAKIRSDAFVKPGPGATGVPVPSEFPHQILLRQEAIGMVKPDGSAAPRSTSWPEGVWDWPIPVSFEQGLMINGLIITGGQIAASTRGEAIFAGDLRAQTRNVMETIQKIIEGFDVETSALAKMTIFYATKGDPADLELIMSEVVRFFSNDLPPITIVPLARIGLTGIDIEIEAIGEVPMYSPRSL